MGGENEDRIDEFFHISQCVCEEEEGSSLALFYCKYIFIRKQTRENMLLIR